MSNVTLLCDVCGERPLDRYCCADAAYKAGAFAAEQPAGEREALPHVHSRQCPNCGLLFSYDTCCASQQPAEGPSEPMAWCDPFCCCIHREAGGGGGEK